MCGRCGEGELVGGVHTLVWRSVQVYHELQELEEEDKGREEVQGVERESQVEEKRSHEDDHVDGVKDSNILSHGVCARDDVKLKTEEMRLCAQTMRAHLGVSGSGQWCTHRATSASCSVTQSLMLSLASTSCFVTQSLMLSLASASCFVTKP